jgi:uncharacterized phage protein gp47/JayE
MSLSLAQLTAPKTIAEMRQQLIDALQGRGVVTKNGTGTGSLTLTGAPSAAADLAILVITGGELGTMTFQLSLDGGATYGATITSPVSGTYDLAGYSVTLQFAAGPSGGGTSFIASDTFTFSLTQPSATVGAWQAGSVPRTLVEIDAQALADLTAMVAAIAKGGLVTDQPGVTGASGSWLTLIAASVYGLARQDAVAALVTVRLTDAGSAGPFPITDGQLWVSTASGKRFTNTVAGTLALGGTLDLAFQAESPGAAWNSGDSSIVMLETSLPGVTVSNPGPNSFTTSGVDEEGDQALATRCIGRWAALGTGSPSAAYDVWARTASAEVTRTKVVASGTTGGQVDLYLGGTAGGVSGGAISVVAAYVTPKQPLGSTLNAISATATAITITATVNIYSAYLTASQALCEAALSKLIAAVPIGGTLYLSQIVDALQSVKGVRNVSISAPVADVALTTAQVATLAGTRTYTGV